MITTANTDGQFKLSNFTGLKNVGTWKVYTSFAGNNNFLSSSSKAEDVQVVESTGYDIIVQGKVPSGEGLDSHNRTTNKIREALIKRKIDDSNIYYFNYDSTQDGWDAQPTKDAIQSAIEVWAKGKINLNPGPLYFIMTNHGSVGKFHVDDEVITPEDLDTWFNTLETSLTQDALNQKRIIIDGSCFSGSFIPTLSKAGRIIITSAAADEESYKGLKENDTEPRDGEFFLTEFFKELESGESFKNAFINATDRTEMYTKRGTGGANSPDNKYFDKSIQHPFAEDNGDGEGSNDLRDVSIDDGAVMTQLYLGVGTNPSPAGKISAMIPPVTILPDVISTTFLAKVPVNSNL